MGNILEIKNLVVNFYTYEGVVKALNDVSFSVDHGSTFGLVGESGCGKSVTARAIMRIIQEPGRIESGQVILYPETVDGNGSVDLLKQSEAYMEDLRGNQISMIFQEPNAALNPIMSIGDQVAESFLFHQKQILCETILSELSDGQHRPSKAVLMCLKTIYGKAADDGDSFFFKLLGSVPFLRNWDRRLKSVAIRRAVSLIGKLGIPQPERIVNLYPHNLSGGMKQRIVIAIGLASNPLLLIADEATSNLDVTIQAQILELLKILKKDGISSILLITHDLGVVAETCDRVGVMYAGNICEIADVREVFEAPLHPYTRALLKSVPKINQDDRLASIPGNVPNLVNPPSGCRFHPRCMAALPICRHEAPALVNAHGRHLVACHNSSVA
ncbi:MAG: ABC transporter ATP-binding protein [Desulfobacteraceae bacterium]|nr:ABC transporter ATP-binding protein [Desulfobacteraceae bacterium]